ncbi:hypothetical protein GP486_003522 [Trichoglossum hirsutum]|uniref:RING-type domain-containing protein n=1 Tax=Trichoglossum hirsutum TaxID=265104 RepID=A0A9P8LCY9_9PEZI|nr:hypothetical protein GP486_003522 [Trichoglossum hirsutum]
MEPLSVAASIASLLALTVDLIKAVDAIATSVRSQPGSLRDTIHELSALKLVLGQLQRVVPPDGPLSSEDKALITVLEGCLTTYHSIGKELSDVQGNLKKGTLKKIYTQVTFTNRMKSIDGLRNQLEKYKATIVIALHLRNLDTRPEDLRSEISQLRAELDKFNTRSAPQQTRLGAIQQYLMASSNIVERAKLGDNAPQLSRSISDVSSTQTGSSVTPVTESSAPSVGDSEQSSQSKLETFQSFKDWLSSFAPESDGGSRIALENIAALRAKHQELQSADEVPVSADPQLATESPITAFNAASFDVPATATNLETRSIRLVITNLHRLGDQSRRPEEIEIGTDAQLYRVVQILYERGHENICGFRIEKSIDVGPITGHSSAVPVLVTSGRSSYCLASGLRINQDESLAVFYDGLLTADPSGGARSSFSIHRKLHGIVVQDAWVNHNLPRIPDMTITFDRTLRIPENGKAYHLPAILGTFPVLSTEYFKRLLPPTMPQKGGVFLPMFQREALVISLRSSEDEEIEAAHYAIRVYAGSVNAISGGLGQDLTVGTKQDYILAPRQRRLDGFCAGKGTVKQFVAMPIGFKYTVESQITGNEFIGGIQLEVAPRLKGRGHYSLHGLQKDCGPLTEDVITTPDSLDRFKSPRQLGLPPGSIIYVEGEELEDISKTLKVRGSYLRNLEDDRIFPRCEAKCRPTFVHELYVRTRSSLMSLPTMLKVEAIRPLSIFVQRDVDTGSKGPKPGAIQRFSKFMDADDFKTRLSEEHKTPPQYIHFNGVAHESIPKVYDPIENYHLEDGVISFSHAMYYRMKKVKLDTWKMGLAAGGGVHQETHADANPLQWNWKKAKLFSVQILNSVVFEEVTGSPAPPCPISFQDYAKAKMPFYQIVHENPIEGSKVLKAVSSVGQLDAAAEIPFGVTVRKDSGPVGCLVCERRLCDSILEPCKHLFCYSCVQKYMSESTPSLVCAACLEPATHLVEFSAPMEAPIREVVPAKSDRIEPKSRNPTTSYRSRSEKPARNTEADVWGKALGLSPSSPDSSEFLEVLQAITDGRTTLQEAAEIGDVVHIQNLLAAKVPIDEPATEKGGRTALQAACEMGHPEVVTLLLSEGCSVNEEPAVENGRTSLQAACGSGHLEVVEILLAGGADVNAAPCRINGRSALQAAAEFGSEEIVQRLIQSHADISILCCQQPNLLSEHTNCPGRTALHFAAEKGYEQLVRLLLDTSSDQDIEIDLDSILLLAARNGHAGIVKFLLERGVDPNAAGDNGVTALHESAIGGFDSTVLLLLEHGADIKAKTRDQETPIYLSSKHGHESTSRILMEKFGSFKPAQPYEYEQALHSAAGNGEEACVLLLLKLGFDPDGNTNGIGETPLHSAAEKGLSSIVEALLEHGANLHAVSDRGETVLHRAARGGHEDMVRVLLSKGLNPEDEGDDGDRVIHEAARGGHEAIVRLLVEYGVDVTAESTMNGTALAVAARKGPLSLVEFLLEKGLDPNVRSRDHTALTEAIDAVQVDVAKLLLDHGADVNLSTFHGVTCFQLACELGSEAMVRLLLPYGVNPKDYRSRTGETALHSIVFDESIFWLRASALPVSSPERHRTASLLLEQGIDVNAPDNISTTPLEKAVRCDNAALVQLFLSHGASPELADARDGSTLLHAAAYDGLESIVSMLLGYGANVNALCRNNISPLYLAAQCGHTTTVRLLVEHGADIDMPGPSGETPLHFAVQKRQYPVVRTLLELGAKVDPRMAWGKTPLMIAADMGNSRIVWLLLESGADGEAVDDAGKGVRDCRHPTVLRVLALRKSRASQ